MCITNFFIVKLFVAVLNGPALIVRFQWLLAVASFVDRILIISEEHIKYVYKLCPTENESDPASTDTISKSHGNSYCKGKSCRGVLNVEEKVRGRQNKIYG